MPGTTSYTGQAVLNDALPVDLLRFVGDHKCRAYIYEAPAHVRTWLLVEGPNAFCREALRRYLQEHPEDRGYTTPVS